MCFLILFNQFFQEPSMHPIRSSRAGICLFFFVVCPDSTRDPPGTPLPFCLYCGKYKLCLQLTLYQLGGCPHLIGRFIASILSARQGDKIYGLATPPVCAFRWDAKVYAVRHAPASRRAGRAARKASQRSVKPNR